MAPQKLPKNQLASEHLLITKKEKSVIRQMAKKRNLRISDMVKELIVCYVDDMYNRGMFEEKDFKRFMIK